MKNKYQISVAQHDTICFFLISSLQAANQFPKNVSRIQAPSLSEHCHLPLTVSGVTTAEVDKHAGDLYGKLLNEHITSACDSSARAQSYGHNLTSWEAQKCSLPRCSGKGKRNGKQRIVFRHSPYTTNLQLLDISGCHWSS